MKKAVGLMPACMTIWNSDQSYSKPKMEKYLRWLLEQGAQCLSICGSTGENITMSHDEQKEIMDHVLGFIAGEVPVFCGTGVYPTMHTVMLSKFAEEHGADGVMVILPYYLTPHKKAVMNHFRELRQNISIPIMVYNNPWFTGYELTPLEVKTLVDEGVVSAIKAAHGDANRVHELKFHCGDKLDVFYGHDYAAMEGLLAGADGWLSGFPAILPRACRDLQDICIVEKNVDKARAQQAKMQPFIDYFFYDKEAGVPHWQEVCKYTLTAQGLDVGLPRRPLGDLDDANKKKIEKLLADLL
ncbi:dihydrodipicolinate synthase family protein [Consotaella salsifontis]|uniref:4-hydroxy-tetrahydrodipicolinate synthase n=1 Tax=Consotaella salsifontis TaxID=1365950 RepID=A0A1T4MGU4_9HYPH|nr:dihydrodipicolinate synthase family protein [Consotaella salsifontis]SJZ66133.1 4-hydroxy-tetrahydrodipicolinate synthase [Consotaella salsifontis]